MNFLQIRFNDKSVSDLLLGHLVHSG